jgi:hypothetical protein
MAHAVRRRDAQSSVGASGMTVSESEVKAGAQGRIEKWSARLRRTCRKRWYVSELAREN